MRWIKLCFVAAGALYAGQAPLSPSGSYDLRVEHAWIPMKDGVRLAADLFMPEYTSILGQVAHPNLPNRLMEER